MQHPLTEYIVLVTVLLMFNLRFGPGLSTAISSTAVLATLDSSNPVSSTNKYQDFKVID